MRTAEDFLKDFKADMQSGRLEKEYLENSGPQFTNQFIQRKVKDFESVMDNDIVANILNGAAKA